MKTRGELPDNASETVRDPKMDDALWVLKDVLTPIFIPTPFILH